ncbi:hypothetical protein E8K88_06300 [Lampropedia aestuarii]|uniref:Uncharacterized protein n=1 Tax=Lampropedia aestuarii TaxID=2562762 RepID=A0A4S5BU24_9BURK|nr:hypothetical protein [Lampropedia aestuarii]THJ34591.1 hypothetical protein E8K88_06300 [Lampropedia aestuarii]
MAHTAFGRAAGAGLAPLAAVQALACIAQAFDETAEPYHWYRQFVLAGAVAHGLPAPDVAPIQSTVPQDGLDTERQRFNSATLGLLLPYDMLGCFF